MTISNADKKAIRCAVAHHIISTVDRLGCNSEIIEGFEDDREFTPEHFEYLNRIATNILKTAEDRAMKVYRESC